MGIEAIIAKPSADNSGIVADISKEFDIRVVPDDKAAASGKSPIHSSKHRKTPPRPRSSRPSNGSTNSVSNRHRKDFNELFETPIANRRFNPTAIFAADGGGQCGDRAAVDHSRLGARGRRGQARQRAADDGPDRPRGDGERPPASAGGGQGYPGAGGVRGGQGSAGRRQGLCRSDLRRPAGDGEVRWLRGVQRLPRADRAQGPRRRGHRHAGPLAHAAVDRRGQGGQGCRIAKSRSR